jgi:hypothetical protein
MPPTRPACATRSRHRHRRGISVVLVVIVLIVLVGFASLAVDVGRVRVANVQVQTAADAAATAAASGMEMFPTRGVLEPQDRAVEAAVANLSLNQAGGTGERRDTGVALVPDEDITFGRWDDSQQPPAFVPILAGGSGPDPRRQADAIRVWARRVTSFKDENGVTINRGTGVPLIFTPALPNGPFHAQVQSKATAVLNGGIDTAAFVGLQYVRFTGATRVDSYHAANETYPGGGGANANASIASNGEIRFTGAAQINGSVYPGKNQWIEPRPLAGNINITGHMFPLSKPLTAVTPQYSPPAQADAVPGVIMGDPWPVTPTNEFLPQGGALLISQRQPNNKPTNFVFSRWATDSNDVVTIYPTESAVDIWINGNFSHLNTARIVLGDTNHPVTFHINGDTDLRGHGVIHPPNGWPDNLRIFMSRPGSRLTFGGPHLSLAARVHAPVTDIVFSGNGTGSYEFFGRVVGKSLTVASNVQLHYDEWLGTATDPKFRIRIVE